MDDVDEGGAWEDVLVGGNRVHRGHRLTKTTVRSAGTLLEEHETLVHRNHAVDLLRVIIEVCAQGRLRQLRSLDLSLLNQDLANAGVFMAVLAVRRRRSESTT